MAHPDETRLKVRTAYVRGRMTLADAAEEAGVSTASAKAWKKWAKDNGDDWDIARNAARMAAGGLGDMTTEVLEDFILQFKQTMDDLRNDKSISAISRADTLAKLSDSYAKTAKAAASGNNNMAKLSIALEVLEQLGQFIHAEYPHHATAFVEILEPFGAVIGRHYG